MHNGRAESKIENKKLQILDKNSNRLNLAKFLKKMKNYICIEAVDLLLSSFVLEIL